MSFYIKLWKVETTEIDLNNVILHMNYDGSFLYCKINNNISQNIYVKDTTTLGIFVDSKFLCVVIKDTPLIIVNIDTNIENIEGFDKTICPELLLNTIYFLDPTDQPTPLIVMSDADRWMIGIKQPDNNIPDNFSKISNDCYLCNNIEDIKNYYRKHKNISWIAPDVMLKVLF